jgi:hypothetical protein
MTVMSTGDPNFQDLSQACWRCTYWGGFAFVGLNHSKCSRLNATSIQASPASGCAFWRAGSGDSLPAGWMPAGFVPWSGPKVYGKPPEPGGQPVGSQPDRSHLPCDRFEFDQRVGAAAWRLADELLSRARRS